MVKEYDVAIIGGGPSGSSCGCLLKQYKPDIKVGIFEREVFPRDHVGESLLPPVSNILNEIGAWDKVEAANFPIKIGVTYKWGKTPELWDFEFLPTEHYKDDPRPAPFAGQRLSTSFNVDRSIYDKILLDHAQEMGCEVFEGMRVTKVNRTGDRVDSLELANGDTVIAKHYIDATGMSAILRREMEVEVDYPSPLKNIAIWGYWQNAKWAEEIGVGATRVNILSLPYGWIWFIPLGPTRTSIGLVTHSEYYKTCGKKPEQLYLDALQEETRIAALLKDATYEEKLYTTNDWSYCASRVYGDNWYLIGQSAAFADPILSVGMTMAHYAARECAFTILEIERGSKEVAWLKEEMAQRQIKRVLTHMRFAEFWYSANAQFKDLKVHISKLAKDVGLELTPDRAWAWISLGGFINEDGAVGTAGFSLSFVKNCSEFMSPMDTESPLKKYNVFELDLSGATYKDRAWYVKGEVVKEPCYVRGDRVLPIAEVIKLMVNILQKTKKSSDIIAILQREAQIYADKQGFMSIVLKAPQALEAMIRDGWVKVSYDPDLPMIPEGGNALETQRWHKDVGLRDLPELIRES